MYYTWEQQKSFDETKVLEFLPPKMRTDIAMRVGYICDMLLNINALKDLF